MQNISCWEESIVINTMATMIKMALVHVLLVIHLLQTSYFVDCTSSCFGDAAKKLSPYDGLLSGRILVKQALVRNDSSRDEFIVKMENFTSNGTEYTSVGTTDWLTEIVQGLSESYDEVKNPAAGYEDITDNITKFLEEKVETNEHLYFKIHMSGIFEHYWVIEQLRDKEGYRVFQSIGDAYSLKAWLTTDEKDFEQDHLWTDGHIKYWRSNYERLNRASPDIFKNIKTQPLDLQPWLTFVKDYNRTLITHNLRRAWVYFGGGREIDVKDFQREYVVRLSKFTKQMQAYLDAIKSVDSTKIWTIEMNDLWIELFGSPNIYFYPGLSAVSDTLKLPNWLRIDVKTITGISKDEASENSEILARSVEHDINDLGYCSEAHIKKINVSLLFVMVVSYILVGAM